MSMFGNSHYRWRETYFVLFDSKRRPSLEEVQKVLVTLNENYELANLTADDAGRFESLTLLSPEDFAALDICYLSGQEVLEHGAELADDMESAASDAGEDVPTKRIRRCDGRFDVLHFERVSEFPEEEEEGDEMLDPGALLLVLGELAKLTDGIAVDPQSGSILSEEQ
ncbi:MAG TPA: hypothetical protein VMY42_08340 [Thermoguttaceae bacterium]|nr:hypothetical protein [Thermoguttaceae bacterium]